jgi:hypothetical protein
MCELSSRVCLLGYGTLVLDIRSVLRYITMQIPQKIDRVFSRLPPCYNHTSIRQRHSSIRLITCKRPELAVTARFVLLNNISSDRSTGHVSCWRLECHSLDASMVRIRRAARCRRYNIPALGLLHGTTGLVLWALGMPTVCSAHETEATQLRHVRAM